MTNSLFRQEYVTTDSVGTATVTLRPATAQEYWHITRIVVSGNAPGGQFQLYLDSINPSSIIDSTSSPQSDVSETNLALGPHNSLHGVWYGCAPGNTYSLSIMGEFS